MEIKTGERAPLFSLRSYDKSEVSLEEFHGKNVVLLFFPLAFSSVCTEELCQVRDGLKDYDSLDATILAVSVDSLYTLKKFREVYDYNFQLLSDFNKEVSRSYGAIHEEFALGMKGVSKRAVFVIDKNGTIRYKEVLDVPSQMPDFEQVKATLESIN